MTFRAFLIFAVPFLALSSTASSGDVEIDGKFISTVPPGIPALEVTSPTVIHNLNADLLDGLDSSAFLPAAGNVILVAKSGGHFSSIQGALDAITDASPANPYLVIVGPGNYQEQVTMKPYVDIQGSGRDITTISWAGANVENATLLGASNAELRHLTVQNTGAGQNRAWAIVNQGASPRITNVKAFASTTGSLAQAIRNEAGSAPELRHVLATAISDQPSAIANVEASPTLKWVEAYASGDNSVAIKNVNASEPTLNHVLAVGSTGSGAGIVLAIGSSGGTTQVTDVVAEASGGETNTGFMAENGALLHLSQVQASVQGNGGTHCYGIQSIESQLSLVHGEVAASGCSTENLGVRSDRSDVSIHGSVLSASSATSHGISNIDFTAGGGPCTLEVHGSQITGGTSSVNTDTDCTTQIGGSSMNGGTAGAGTAVCAGVYDDGMTFEAGPTCP